MFIDPSEDDNGLIHPNQPVEHPEDVAAHQNLQYLTRDIFDEYYPFIVMRHSPPHSDSCLECGSESSPDTWVMCEDCFDSPPMCTACALLKHHYNPFHRVKTWNSEAGCWTPTHLADLGLQVPAIHANGERCTTQGNAVAIQVIHSNGNHRILLRRCGCTREAARLRTVTAKQCLAHGLFPATNDSPQQAFTFQVLDLFHTCNLKAFTNINQFLEIMAAVTPIELRTQVKSNPMV
jgi:hypothetical protein